MIDTHETPSSGKIVNKELGIHASGTVRLKWLENRCSSVFSDRGSFSEVRKNGWLEPRRSDQASRLIQCERIRLRI